MLRVSSHPRNFGIPISFMGTFLLMPTVDVSISMISLFAFIVYHLIHRVSRGRSVLLEAEEIDEPEEYDPEDTE